MNLLPSSVSFQHSSNPIIGVHVFIVILCAQMITCQPFKELEWQTIIYSQCFSYMDTGIPVQVKSTPTVAYIASDHYDWVYDDTGTGAHVEFSIWRPQLFPGYFSLGDVAKTGHSKPNTTAMQVRELVAGSLAMPIGSINIWDTIGSGGWYDVHILKLIAPPGYICLGNVAVSSHKEPNYNAYRCVKESYLTNGVFQLIWKDSGPGAKHDFSVWAIQASSSDSLPPIVFESHKSHSTPDCCPKVLQSSHLKKESYSTSYFPLCKLDTVGQGYAGSEDMTSTSKTCKHWVQLSTAQKSILPADSTVPLEENYCRNPTGKPNGPWCFVGSELDDWEYCSIGICKPSATCTMDQNGQSYVGSRSLSKSGRICQRWDRQHPNRHQFTSDHQFPDATVQDAANFCRNPEGQKTGVWCYTTDSTKEWEYCDIPVCSNCKDTKDGRGYAGTKSTDEDGISCIPWKQTAFRKPEFFPDPSVSDASNYCRNPDRDHTGPWCMVSGARGQVKSYCGIPLCHAACPGNSQKGSFRHVLHVGIDGLHSTCWQNASGGTPNLRSLAAKGSYTYSNARAEAITFSGPNWGSHLCGMGIQSSGILHNFWIPPWTGAHGDVPPVNGKTYPMPCAFNYLKGSDNNVRTGMFHNWDWFNHLGNGGIPGSVDLQYTGPDGAVVGKAVDYLTKVLEAGERSYTFVHMDQVDAAGHASFWCSSRYLSAVDNVDLLLGKLLKAVREDKSVLVIVSSDHGGDTDHGHMRESNMLIPMFINGLGVRRGYSLTRPVRNRDILPTAAWALGIQASPFWDGDVMKEAFED